MTQQVITGCDAEPIHTPGHIQNYGVLFVLDDDGVVRQVSDNCLEIFGCPTEVAIGQQIDRLLYAKTPRKMQTGRCTWRKPKPRGFVKNIGRYKNLYRSTRLFDVMAHCNKQNIWLVECEIVHAQSRRISIEEKIFQRRISQALQIIYDAANLQELVAQAVQQIFFCFGFDRVMAYRFDNMWNGTVVAEKVRPGIGSYLNQKFPASDIPKQARRTFFHNVLRIIPNVQFRPSPIVPARWPNNAPPLDMLMCHLRAPSPIHIEYLENMGVASTMTVSLLSRGTLWGLIACHHFKPLSLSFDHRQAAEIFGRCISSLLASRKERDSLEHRQRVGAVQQQLFAAMSCENDLVTGLTKSTPNVLNILHDTVTSSAIYFEGRWSFLGQVPSVSALNALIKWLSENKANEDVWATDCLMEQYPPAELFSDVASGLLALNIPKSDDTYVLWFRPELVRMVSWAGNPEKSVVFDSSGSSLHPRDSFQQWCEIVKFRARAWEAEELEAAFSLRKNIIELDLQRQFRRERLARADTEAEKRRFSILADATSLLAASLDYKLTLQSFAQFVCQWFCDWVCVYLEGEDGLQRNIVAHATPQGSKVAEKLHKYLPVYKYLPEQTRGVFERGEYLYVPRTQPWLQDTESNEYVDFLRQNLGFESMLLLPILARHKTLGVIKFVRSDRARRFTMDDHRLASQLCQRAASCIENALLYRRSQEAIQVREYVMGVVSHDLRNPLGAVKLTAQLMSRRLAKSEPTAASPRIAQGLKRIDVACQRMDNLIEEFLSLSKIEAGRFRVECKPTPVAALIEEALVLLKPLAAAKNVQLYTIDMTGLPDVHCDTERMMQVFSNLVGNAIKFTPEQGTIRVGAQQEGEHIVFCIVDTGPGIPAEDLPFIFDKFWQASHTARQGTGLGLAIAKGIVEAHAGTIWVQSVLQAGTTFSFRLPISQP